MVDRKSVRKLALALPDVVDESGPDTLRFSVGGKGFAWTYLERVAPKAPRVARPDILAVRCALEHKHMLIDVKPDIFFDDDHYRGYPAVLVRLAAVDKDTLASLLDGALRFQAAKRRPKAKAKNRRAKLS
jgi:hypothetical protein